jgi:DNA-binding IclR family transcriptional regulator
MTRYLRRNPGATYEELAEAAGWKIPQVERVVVAWEAWGVVYRDRQWDRANGRWATCVQPAKSG